MHEVVSFEEEWLSRQDRERVREAVAVIQACVIQVAQSFGAGSRLDDDGNLDERGDRHQTSISGLDGFDEGTPFGFALQDGNEGRRVDDHLARQTVLVVAEYLVRRSGVEDGQIGAVLRNGLELIRKSSPRAFAPHSREAITEYLGHRFGLGFASLPGQFGSEPFGFRIANIEGHINTCRRLATV
jgi:hypothetical protein